MPKDLPITTRMNWIVALNKLKISPTALKDGYIYYYILWGYLPQ